MTQEVIFSVIGLFLITSFTNILATLKTILISKKIMNPVYIVVFIDATIFATVLTKVVGSTGFYYTIAYALGRTFGVFAGHNPPPKPLGRNMKSWRREGLTGKNGGFLTGKVRIYSVIKTS